MSDGWLNDPLWSHGGGPAFPSSIPETQERGAVYFKGMSLRDWFAGQALAGYCAREGSFIRNPADVAKEAYADADAMLKASEAKS